MFQAQFQTTRPLTTAHLAQTMMLLSMPGEELRQEIDAALAANPALEMIEERRCPTCHRILSDHGKCPVCSLPKTADTNDPVVFLSPRDDFIPKRDYIDPGLDNEPFSPEVEELPTYVLKQIAPDLDQNQRSVAAYLLTHLDEYLLLTTTILEVSRYTHAMPSEVEKVKRLIQHADPIGVGSNTTTEALLIQLEILRETESVPEIADRVIQEGMSELSHHQYAELAHKLGVSLKQVTSAAKFIGDNLNPFPARSHWGDVRQPVNEGTEVYHQPDIIINYLNDDPSKQLMVEIIMPTSGTLQVNPLFKQAVK